MWWFDLIVCFLIGLSRLVVGGLEELLVEVAVVGAVGLKEGFGAVGCEEVFEKSRGGFISGRV